MGNVMKNIRDQIKKLKALIFSAPISKRILNTKLVKLILAHPKFQKAFACLWMAKNVAFYAFVFRVPLLNVLSKFPIWIGLLLKNLSPLSTVIFPFS